jgi:branched-chain amino acid transport system permease protein
MSEFLQFLINGISVGSLYALIALGYTMVYGIIQLINFAHGEFLMMGAFAGAITINRLEGTPLAVALIVSMLAAGMIAVVTELVAYRPLRGQSKIFVLTAAIAVSVLLQNLGRLLFGASAESFPAQFPQGSVSLEPLGLSVWIEYSQLLILGLCVVLAGALWLIVNKTKVGTAMRATSQDIDAARLMGINTNVIISFTFFIGASLAGAVGVLYGMQYSIDPLMGIQPGLAAFVAAVLGGIGSIPGAMIGGLLIGIIENLVAGYMSSTYQGAITFVILIIVLSVKPTGLLGRLTTVKV